MCQVLLLPGVWGYSGKHRGVVPPFQSPQIRKLSHFRAMGQELWQTKPPGPGGDPIIASLQSQDFPFLSAPHPSLFSLCELMWCRGRTTVLEAERPEFEGQPCL